MNQRMCSMEMMDKALMETEDSAAKETKDSAEKEVCLERITKAVPVKEVETKAKNSEIETSPEKETDHLAEAEKERTAKVEDSMEETEPKAEIDSELMEQKGFTSVQN